MAERGVTVTYETIRAWCERFGREYTKRIRARRGKLGDTWHLDEVFIKIGGRLQYVVRKNLAHWFSWGEPAANIQ